MFIRTRDVPHEWQAELEMIVPRSSRVPWLKIVWQPGIEYQPVQRWEIYEMMPLLGYVPFEIRHALEGPNPREFGEWMELPPGSGQRRWITSSLVTLMQWQLFRETGCYAARFWILQGTRGGHKWKLSNAEKNFLQSFTGVDIDTPIPGALPYAGWDRRTAAKILHHDRLRRWKYTMPWESRQANRTKAGLWVKRDRMAEEQAFAEEMLHYLESQISDVVSDIPRRLLPGWSDLPEGDRHYNQDEDALDQSLVTETASATPED